MKRRKRNETMGETGYSVMSDSRNGDAYRMQRGTQPEKAADTTTTAATGDTAAPATEKGSAENTTQQGRRCLSGMSGRQRYP